MNIHHNIKFSNKTFLLIIILVSSLGNSSIFANNTNEPLEILFIGNSYTNFNNLPNVFYNLTTSAGKEIFVDSYAPPGTSLFEHSNNANTLSKIREKKWDFIILQGTGRRIAYPDSFTDEPAFTALAELEEIILNNCESTRIIFFMPWADEDGMTWIEGWTQNYEEMQIDIYNSTIQFSNKMNYTIAPVGWAWYKVLDEKNYPLHYLHAFDWNHPRLNGTYLTACVIYSTIFVESTSGIQYYAGLELSEGVYLQTIASNTVLDNLKDWKIKPYVDTTFTDTINTEIIEFETPGSSKLYQNFPNPFNEVTHIKYMLFEETKVEIELFDLLGKKYAVLVNETKLPGSYTIEFDGSNFKSGVYFFGLKTDKNYQIKKC